MKIVIIDGQSGKIGKSIVEQILKKYPDLELYGIGTNSLATSAMLKGGAVFCATGENACVINARDADIILGPIGIVFANSLLGEITPKISSEVGGSKAYKILIPTNQCNHFISACNELGLSDAIKIAVDRLSEFIEMPE